MSLKQLMQKHQITIIDLEKLTSIKSKRLHLIIDQKAQASLKERNTILKAFCQFKINPLELIF
jgi:4-alpha-glucanotransferase